MLVGIKRNLRTIVRAFFREAAGEGATSDPGDCLLTQVVMKLVEPE